MTEPIYPQYPTSNGYLTEEIRQKYITKAIANNFLPNNAHRIAEIVSLSAPKEIDKPIQFWQLFSVLGLDRIIAFVAKFYERVYADEQWFKSVFERVGDMDKHINSQSAMWIDVMGGGHYYHGGEFRLSFHHTHNAIQLMNDRGAQRWLKLMVETLDDPSCDLTDDPRVRPSLNTFLSFFFEKYADEFRFSGKAVFGDINPPVSQSYQIT